MIKQFLRFLYLLILFFVQCETSPAQISDPLEYPVGGVTYSNVAPAITQIQTCPLPRFKKGHTLLPNFAGIDPIYFGGYKMAGVTDPQAIHNQADLQREFIKNWNYMVTVNWFGPGPYSDTCNAIANANPSIKTCVESLRAQTGGSQMFNQNLANDHYLQTGGGTFLDLNGNPTAYPYKTWRPTAPPSDYSSDGDYVKNAFNASFATLTRNVDFCMEDGEVYPFIGNNALVQDPNCVTDRNLLNIQWNGGNSYPWFPWLGRKVADNDKAYSAKFLTGVARLSGATYTEYRLDGQVQFQFNWQEARKMMTKINNQYYCTTDLYTRFPDNWQNWVSAWHGLRWVTEALYFQRKVGDTLFSPFVGAGWNVDETQNIRPAQWLGLMKIMGMIGAEFYYPSFFVETLPPADPKGYAWQAVIPIYAQAVTSYWEDLLRNGDIMPGDVTDNQNNIEIQPAYRFNAGAVRNQIYARKKKGAEVYVIEGIIENSENTAGVTPLTSTATFQIAGETLTINTSRQGNTYIWDRTNLSDKKFYQLDAWHEYKHPTRWSQDITWDNEVTTSKSAGVTIKTEGAVVGDYTAANSYIKFSAVGDTVSYAVQRSENSQSTRYFWIKARSSTGISTGIKIRIGATTRNISCITNTSWKWYRVDSALNVPISFSMPASQVDLILTAKNSVIEIDKFYLIESSADVYGATTTSCGSVVCTITPSGPTTFCTGGSVTLTANSGTSYLWSTAATTQAITVSTAGTYMVTVTTGGIPATCAPITVIVNTIPTATITPSGSTSFCSGSSVNLTANSASSYLWSTGATTQAINVSTASTFTVTITSSGNCTASASTATTVLSLPTATITPTGSTTFCTGSSVLLTVTANTSYLWSTGATTQAITVTTAGAYTATVTGANGCTKISSGTVVTVNALPTATISAGGSTTFCTGGSVVLTSSSGTSYLWSTTATTQAITVSSAGNYTVIVTNAAGCTKSSIPTTIALLPIPTAVITAGGATTFCTGGSVTLSATTGSGYTYLWKRSGTGIGSATSSTYVATVSGNYTVVVTASGCSATSNTIAVTVASSPTTANAGPDQSICTDSTSFTGNTPVVGTGTWTLVSGSGTITTPSSPTSAVTGIGAGSNVFKWTIANSPCTSSSDNISIITSGSSPVSITITASVNPFCSGATIIFTAIPTNGGTPSYQWKKNGGNVGSNSATYSTVGANGDLITCVLTSSAVCATGSPATSNTITEALAPISATITAGGPTTFCTGGTVTFSANIGAGFTYQWKNSGGNIAGETNSTYSASATETYTCVVTNSTSCSATSNSIAVTVSAIPTATITPSGATTFCSGNTVTLTSSANTSYAWNTGATTQAIVVASSGSYAVIVTTGGCTAASTPVAVSVLNKPTAIIVAGGSTTFCNGGFVILTATGGTGYSYQWQDTATNIVGAVNQMYGASISGRFRVVITALNGCSATSNTIVVTADSSLRDTIIAIGDTTVCYGDSVYLTSTVSGTSYLWSNGATTQNIYVKISANYKVTVTQSNGCTSTSSGISATIRPKFVVAIDPNGGVICTGDSLLLRATGGATYLWNTSDTSQFIYAKSAGTYTVTVTGGNGCTGISGCIIDTINCNACIAPPSSSAVSREVSVKLDWQTIAPARDYLLELTNDQTKVSKELTFKDSNATIGKLNQNTQYHYRLRSVCGTSIISDYSKSFFFRTTR